MAILPGWDSLDGAAKWAGGLHIAGYVALGLLFVFEVLAFIYDHRRDNLLAVQQASIERQRVDERQKEQHNSQAVIDELQRRLKATEQLGTATQQDLKSSRNQIDKLEKERAPRALTPSQTLALNVFLSKHPSATLTIQASMNAPDAKAYAEQIAALLRAAGWQVGINDVMFAGTGIDGLRVVFKSNTATPAGAVTLYDAFKSAGIPIRAEYDPTMSSESAIFLAIGTK